MISAQFARYLNTIFGICDNGEYLCLDCGQEQRDALLHGRAEDGVFAITGTDFYNAGESENEVECGECGWHGAPEDEEPYHTEKRGCTVAVTPRYICSECSKLLSEAKEE